MNKNLEEEERLFKVSGKVFTQSWPILFRGEDSAFSAKEDFLPNEYKNE